MPTMAVANNSAQVLTNVVVLHWCNGNVDAINLATLAAGATSATVPWSTQAGHNDYYLIQYCRGGAVYQANCYCNSSNSSAWAIVELSQNAYNILYNDTNCTNKSYDYTLGT